MTNNDITIVITMAGLGSRFREAGYTVPKYQIKARGKTLFDWSMESLEGYRERWGEFYFILRAEDNARSFIEERCKHLRIDNFKLIEIDYLTDGQATTAMLAAPYWQKDQSLLIYNIDTYVEAGEMDSTQLCGDGFIPCFNGKGDHWSFVRLDENERAVEVREKKRISEHCTLGAYYFKSCKLYESLYHGYYSCEGKLEKGEKYIAPLYNHLISREGDVFICTIPSEKVHILGTPDELQMFLDEKMSK